MKEIPTTAKQNINFSSLILDMKNLNKWNIKYNANAPSECKNEGRRLRKCSSHKYKTTVIRGGQENRLFICM